MVHLNINHPNTSLLNITNYVANKFESNVVGIMVGLQTQMIYGKTYANNDVFDREDEQLDKKLIDAEILFIKSLQSNSGIIEWRSIITREPIANYIATQARSSDLIITEFVPFDFYEGPGGLHIGEIVLRTGRPVLAIPTSIEVHLLDNILIGWKDTRESRRAILDALPFLKIAKQVTVVEICAEEEISNATKGLCDVIAWLNRHYISAEYLVSPSTKYDATQLLSIAKQRNVNLIVAGAYGHSSFREWVLGGVTNELFKQTEFCCLLSH